MTTPSRAPSAALLASLRLGEGLRLRAYPDPKSYGAPWTIGYGRAGRCKPGDTCTSEEAEAWLREDAQEAVDLTLQHIPWSAQLDPVRFDVLAELVFNMGWGKVADFHRMLGDLEAARDAQAAADLLESGWGRQFASGRGESPCPDGRAVRAGFSADCQRGRHAEGWLIASSQSTRAVHERTESLRIPRVGEA